jgi:predicted acyl esterase
VVKLIDVYPNMPEEKYFRDFNLLVSDEVLRARFRHGNLSDPVPVTPYEITQYEIVLPDRNHVFQKGHMIAVHIQSTWYPLIDNNPQKFVYNLFNATRSDFKVSTNCIYHSEEYPSHLEISIVP